MRGAGFSGSWILVVFSVAVLFSLLPGATGAETKESLQALRAMGEAFASVAEKASPAVVGIRADQVVAQGYSPDSDSPFGDPFADEFFRHFFGEPRRERSREPRKQYRPVQGSGFIVSPQGYILTNNHVVEDAENISVALLDGRKFDAELIGTDPYTEVAVIKIEAEGLKYVEMADSDELEVGQWAIAIGNPFGLSHTVTAGIISAKGRVGVIDEPAAYEDFVQTDAAINPGNSGGPLIDLDGRAVGINTAIIGASGNIGIGLAIPINMAKFVYDRLVAGEPLVRSMLGVYAQGISPELAESLELDSTEGVVVMEVQEDSAADKAGLKAYDVITAIDGRTFATANEFRNRISMISPGTEVELSVIRDGKKRTISATLEARSDEAVGRAEPGEENLEELGFTVEDLTEDMARRLRYEGDEGVVVTKVEPRSQAARKGLEVGMIILEVNRTAVDSVREFNREFEKAAKEGPVMLLVTDGRARGLIVLTPPR
jgi:serine protease Do